jgi:8-oxo-dGTP diphosphatase
MVTQFMPLTEPNNDNNENNIKKATIKNNVVTAFIEYHGKILLLRRSQKVKSMKGKWAAVSGYIERQQEPLRQAFKEAYEETGLTNKNIKVLNEGKPLEAIDNPANSVTWVVHPFYFRTNTNDIILDWEHDQYKWIKPAEIENYDTVPRLKEALDRVAPNSGSRINNNNIGTDNRTTRRKGERSDSSAEASVRGVSTL